LSKKGVGEQKAKQHTCKTQDSDPYLVGGVLEGLQEASTGRGDRTTVVIDSSPTMGPPPNATSSPKKGKKPAPSPVMVNSLDVQPEDASTKVRGDGCKEPLSACHVRESRKLVICNVYGTLVDSSLIAERNPIVA
jgi:hypothetical protein